MSGHAILTEATRAGLTWKIHDPNRVHGCTYAPWCDNLHRPGDLSPECEGLEHARDVATAFRGDEIALEVSVGQWKAIKRWRESATLAYPLRDHEPYVAIFVHPLDGGSKMLALEPGRAEGLAMILGEAGECGPLRDALTGAVDLLEWVRSGKATRAEVASGAR